MSNSKIKIDLHRCLKGFDDLELPAYQTNGSAGVDLRAAIETDIQLNPGESHLTPTAISMAIPTGFEGQVRPRSGLAVKHGITVANAPGTIDSDYRGEIRVALINLSQKPYIITRGERIAQLVIAPVVQAVFTEVEKLEETDRGAGGFGHTGK